MVQPLSLAPFPPWTIPAMTIVGVLDDESNVLDRWPNLVFGWYVVALRLITTSQPEHDDPAQTGWAGYARSLVDRRCGKRPAGPFCVGAA